MEVYRPHILPGSPRLCRPWCLPPKELAQLRSPPSAVTTEPLADAPSPGSDAETGGESRSMASPQQGAGKIGRGSRWESVVFCGISRDLAGFWGIWWGLIYTPARWRPLDLDKTSCVKSPFRSFLPFPGHLSILVRRSSTKCAQDW